MELANTSVTYAATTITNVLEHIPDSVSILNELPSLMKPGGMIGIKCPFGRNQLRREKARVHFRMIEKTEIAMNFVHVNQFPPTAMMCALTRSCFIEARVAVGVPELPPGGGLRGFLSRCFRIFVFGIAKLPRGLHTPLGLNLQAFASAPL